MGHWIEKFLQAWIPLFVAIDPIGLVPLYIGITHGIEHKRRRRIAHQGVWTAALVAIGFMFLGRFVFEALGITLADFQMAGGLILLALATRDIMGAGERPLIMHEDFGVVPLGLPIIAGPATLSALLILVGSVGIPFTLLALALNLVLVDLAFRYAEPLARWMSLTGLRAISKIISLLLAAIAVNMIRRGWQAL